MIMDQVGLRPQLSCTNIKIVWVFFPKKQHITHSYHDKQVKYKTLETFSYLSVGYERSLITDPLTA